MPDGVDMGLLDIVMIEIFVGLIDITIGGFINGQILGILLDDKLRGTLGTSLRTRDGFLLDTLVVTSLNDSVVIILEKRLGFVFNTILDLKVGGML